MRPADTNIGDREVLTDRTDTIGSASKNAVKGFDAFDVDGKWINTFQTKPAARRVVLDHYCGGYDR